MRYEKSCGAVVFTRVNGEIRYVLAQSTEGYYGFPKGHMEAGETETETALREIREEVGLSPRLIEGFRAEDEHPIPSKPGVIKQVVYFLAEYENQTISFQKEELRSAPLVSYEEAIELFDFESSKRILTQAHRWLTKRTTILFVCLGNICRSPMAEFVMKELLKKQGLSDRVHVASAATSGWEIGNPVHHGTKAKLAEHGISCKGKTARQLTKADYAAYDYIIGMEKSNMDDMLNLLGGDPQGKLSLLLNWTGERRAIADPWYTHDFEATWRDVLRGCNALLAHIARESGWTLR